MPMTVFGVIVVTIKLSITIDGLNRTPGKHIFSNAFHGVWDCEGCQPCATIESLVADGCYGSSNVDRS